MKLSRFDVSVNDVADVTIIASNQDGVIVTVDRRFFLKEGPLFWDGYRHFRIYLLK